MSRCWAHSCCIGYKYQALSFTSCCWFDPASAYLLKQTIEQNYCPYFSTPYVKSPAGYSRMMNLDIWYVSLLSALMLHWIQISSVALYKLLLIWSSFSIFTQADNRAKLLPIFRSSFSESAECRRARRFLSYLKIAVPCILNSIRKRSVLLTANCIDRICSQNQFKFVVIATCKACNARTPLSSNRLRVLCSLLLFSASTLFWAHTSTGTKKRKAIRVGSTGWPRLVEEGAGIGSWSFFLLQMLSSKNDLTIGMPSSSWSMYSWNMAVLAAIPRGSTLYLQSPRCVLMTRNFLHISSSSIM